MKYKCDNFQAGPTCSFFAMAFVLAKINESTDWGQVAETCIVQAIRDGKTIFGSVFSVDSLKELWDIYYEPKLRKARIRSEIVSIKSEEDIASHISDTSYLLLPVSNCKSGKNKYSHCIAVYQISQGIYGVNESNKGVNLFIRAAKKKKLYKHHSYLSDYTNRHKRRSPKQVQLTRKNCRKHHTELETLLCREETDEMYAQLIQAKYDLYGKALRISKEIS